MFEFLFADPYEARKVGRYEVGELMVSTVAINDGDRPFETAVRHPSYGGGKLIIVEAYDTRKAAQEGHDRWVATMTAEALPDVLVDCKNSYISQMAGDLIFPRAETP